MSKVKEELLENMEIGRIIKGELPNEVDKLKIKEYGGIYYIYSEVNDE